MRYERQKMIRKELERIPRGLKGSPQNEVRQIVTSQYQHRKSFDESVEIAVNFVRQRYPNFTAENFASSVPNLKQSIRAVGSGHSSGPLFLPLFCYNS